MGKTRIQREIEHGRQLSFDHTEEVWGWGSAAGQLRALRRAALVGMAAGLDSGLNVLEIGCGTGFFTERFAATGARITALDVSPDLLAKAREKNLPSGQVSFREMAFEECDLDNSFDAVVGSSVLHHLDLDLSLRKILDLLRPGGRLCFAEPNLLNPQVCLERNFRSLFPYVSPDETAFIRWRLGKMLRRAGFVETAITPFDWLHPALPLFLIGGVKKLEWVLERLPLVREFAGSLLIWARKPE